MMRSPSLNSACASTPTLGSATTAIGADGPAAGGLWPQPATARSRAATPARLALAGPFRRASPLARLALSLTLPRRRGRGPDPIPSPVPGRGLGRGEGLREG